MSALIQDVRYGWRMLVRNPGFTTTAVATLALGICASTVIFSFVNAVALRPLAFHESRSLVMVKANPPPGKFAGIAVSSRTFLAWQEQNHVFREMAAFSSRTFSLTGFDQPERLGAATVSSRFFETLGVAPIVGHSFQSHERQPDAERVVVISSALWHRQFRADPTVVGRRITLDGETYTVVGVMPERFSFPQDMFTFTTRAVDVWAPLVHDPGNRDAWLRVIARLNPGVSVEAAQAEMATIDRRIATRPGRPPLVVSLHEESVRRVRGLLHVFLGAVGFLLLIACTNVANLLLGRAAARQREIAIRSALGSGRWRLIRQALTESVLLGLVGGAAGLILALFGLDLLIGLIPAGSVPRLAEVKIDGQVLAFTFALSFLTGLVFGIAPALQSTATDLSAALKTSGSSQATRVRLPNAFVVAQVALTVVLLSGAGLMVRSFLNLTAVDPGFRPARVITASVSLPESSYSDYAALRPFAARVLERIRSAPGVEQASAINWLPFGRNLISGDFTADGVEMPRGLVVAKPAVSADYFATMGIPLVRGRALSNQDTERSELVAVVTDQLARQLWPGRDAIGKRLKLGFGRPSEEPWRSVVGVVGDVKQNSQGETTRPALYVPLEQAPGQFLLRDISFVARSAANPMAIASAMRDALHAVDSTLPIDRISTMDELLAEAASEPRFRSVVLGTFASAALLLVATGVFGVLAYAVARRRREIGVRMALGADRRRLVSLVVRHTLRMTVMGLALGLIGAAALTRILTAYLFAVRPLDPTTLAAAAAIVLAVALLATYVPARRAASVDPLEALRAE